MKHNLLRFFTILVLFSSFIFSGAVFAEPIDPSQCVKIVSSSTNGTIALACSVSDKLPTYENATYLTLWYSKNNGVTWTRWTDPSAKITFSGCSPDKTILLKGANPKGFGHPEGNSSWRFINNSYTFTFTGNIMSLIDTLNLDGSGPIPAYCFDKLFSNYAGYLGAGTDLILPAQTLSEGCYWQMFSGCTSITQTPDLSVAKNAPTMSMHSMFKGCTALTTVRGLPQTDTIGEEAMLNMFYGCKNLKSADVPAITANYIDTYGCHQMFAVCTGENFTTPPAMPNLRNIATHGCDKMYYQCTNLTSSPCLNKLEVVKSYGCYLMFDSCLKMTTIDTLKARRLEDHACAKMFWKTSKTGVAPNTTKALAIIVDTVGTYGCYQMFHSNITSSSTEHYDNVLSVIDSLRFRIIENHGCEQMCYRCSIQLKTIPNMRGIKRVGAYGCSQMFCGCPNINFIGSIEIDTIGDYGCYQMFYNACSSANSTINKLKFDVIGSHGCEQMFYNNTYALRDDTDKDWTFSSIGDYGCAQMFVSLSNNRTLKLPNITVRQSVGDHGMYQMFYTCNQVVEIGKLTIRNVGNSGCYQMYAESFTGLNPDIDAIKIDTIGSYGCAGMFYSTFWNRDSKISVTPTIETKLIKDHGCYQMFYGNRRLTTISDISAQKLMDYACAEMFHRTCSTTLVSDATVGKIKADTIGYRGMYRMFSGDFLNSSSTSSHRYDSELSSVDTIITKLICANGCERMFECCTLKLTTSPGIRAQRIEEKGCYQMFWTNDKLTRVKSITVDTICTQALQEMFTSCGAINTIGNLTADTIGENGCTNMFNSSLVSGCTMGNITVTALGNEALYQMFNGRPLGSVGTLNIARAHEKSCYQMFNGCTALTTAGNISVGATTNSSCRQMFNNCNKLTAVPSLTIGNIGHHACQQMFNGCTALTFTGTVNLPQNKVEDFGCAQMFYACSSLPAAATLGALDIGDSAYYQMYRDCSELVTPPASLPSIVVPNGGYEQMFMNCQKLISAPTIAATDVSTDGCANMFTNCSALISIPTMTALQRIGKKSCWEMFSGCTSLTSIPTKTVESIGEYGCYQMFAGCTGLGAVDNLHATSIGSYGCSNMFKNCTGITSVSNLSATNIGEHGCYQMFLCDRNIASVNTISATTIGSYGCSEMFADDSGTAGRAAAPTISNLSFGTIGDYGCYRMFYVKYNSSTNYNYWASINGFTAESVGKYGCADMFLDIKTDNATLVANNKLGSATNIRIGTTDDHALYRMFRSCTVLKTLGLTFTSNSIGTYACQEMFQGCSALPSTQLPALPATNLSKGSYQNMFNGCSSLTSAPTLPATTIPDYVYDGMFRSCGLTSIPALPATKIGKYSYRNMFNTCTNFNSTISLSAKNIDEGGCQGMFQHCTSLQATPTLAIDEIGDYGCNLMFANCTILNVVGELTLGEVGDHGCAQMFNISICGAPKTYLEKNTTVSISINKVGPYGCYQMFRCEGIYSSTSSNAGASVLRQIAKLELGEISRYACCEMFYNCRYMHTIPNILPIMNLYEGCYQGMFQECVSVGTAPKLPATTLAPFCYRNMFKSTSISSAPDLLADKMETSCYESMFENCTSLTSAPNLPSKQLAPRCYANMFNGCSNSSFTTAQTELPATKLANACYLGMFQGCSSLTTSPVLCAPKFEDANGTPTTQAYYQMFYGCSKLTKISTYLESWDGYVQSDANCNTYSWVRDVSNLGTFACTSDLDKTKYGSSNTYASFMPKYSSYKWTVTAIQRMTFNPNGGTWDGIDNTRKVMTPPLSQQPVPMKQGYIFTEWNTAADGSGETLDWTTSPEGDNTYYAQYTPIREFIYARWEQNGVVIHTTLNATKCTILMQQSNQSTEVTLSACQPTGCPGEYILPIDPTTLQENQNKLMNLTFTDADNNEIGTMVVRIPYIVTSDTQASLMPTTDETDIWITNSASALSNTVTFTVDADAQARNIYVDGGCKLVVEEGVILHTKDLILRAGKFSNTGQYTFCYPQLVANGSIINQSGVVNLDYALDLNQFYSLALPYSMNLGDAAFDDGSDAVKNMQVQQYNGETRASGSLKNGWEDLWNPNMGGSTFPDLQAGKGYIVCARDRRFKMDGSSTYVRRANTVIRFPMEVDLSTGEQTVDGTRTIDVHPWGMVDGQLVDGLTPNNAGWNLVGNPFLADIEIEQGLVKNNGIGLLVKQDDNSYVWQGNNRYAVIPSNDGKSFEQVILNGTTLPAFKNFFVQIGSGDRLSFSIAKRAQNAPERDMETSTETAMAVRLSGHGKTDRVGIFLSEDYTNDYEFNADLDKWMNTDLNLYAQVGNYRLGIVAMNPDDAAQSILLGVTVPATDDYTFRLDEEWSALGIETEHAYLEDRKEQTMTDLLTDDYTCHIAEEEDLKGRFRLFPTRAYTPTTLPEQGENAPIALAGEGNIRLCRLTDADVTVYSVTGMRLYSTHCSGTATLQMLAGTYIVSIHQNDSTYTVKLLVH